MKKKSLSFSFYKTGIAFFGCCVLMALTIWEWQVFEDTSIKRSSKTTAKIDEDYFDHLVDYQSPVLSSETYENVVNAPLFIQGRTAIKRQESAMEGSSNFKLTGVILTNHGFLALINDDKNNKFRSKVGEIINGWTVTSVLKDSVELKQENQIQKLLLVDPNKPVNPPVSPVNTLSPDMQNYRPIY